MECTHISKLMENGYPFIYYTEAMGYRYIGSAVFRDCTQEEIDLYNKYRQEINRIHNLTYTPDKQDVICLVLILEKILANGDTEYSDDKARNSCEELREMLQSLSESDLEELELQKRLFIEALDYKDGAFYRHSKDKRN